MLYKGDENFSKFDYLGGMRCFVHLEQARIGSRVVRSYRNVTYQCNYSVICFQEFWFKYGSIDCRNDGCRSSRFRYRSCSTYR